MKPLSLYRPALYWLRVWQKRLFRQLAWRFSRKRYARPKDAFERLPYRYLKHTSKLIRKLGDSDVQLQHNTVVNLKLAQANTFPSAVWKCDLAGREQQAAGESSVGACAAL